MEDVPSIVAAAGRIFTRHSPANSRTSGEKTTKSKDRIYNRRLTLARAVQKRKNLLFGNSLLRAPEENGEEDGEEHSIQSRLNVQRRGAWEDVRLELLAHGFSEYKTKTSSDIQKTDWQHVRRFVVDRRKKDSPFVDEPYTELDHVVFDIVKTFDRGCYSRERTDESRSEFDLEMLQDLPASAAFISALSSPLNDVESKAEENGHLPPFAQLFGLNGDFDPPAATSDPMAELNTKILEARLKKEEFLAQQEKLRADIEAERLTQERIRTRLLLCRLTKENPKMAAEFPDFDENFLL
ncbi:hypothetical protein M3Y99_00805100 [Aphelenchoides fujianensis]|nr:hypothetical protein M3Y99_00805100 [Aphelenchoides fujianensis]